MSTIIIYITLAIIIAFILYFVLKRKKTNTNLNNSYGSFNNYRNNFNNLSVGADGPGCTDLICDTAADIYVCKSCNSPNYVGTFCNCDLNNRDPVSACQGKIQVCHSDLNGGYFTNQQATSCQEIYSYLGGLNTNLTDTCSNSQDLNCAQNQTVTCSENNGEVIISCACPQGYYGNQCQYTNALYLKIGNQYVNYTEIGNITLNEGTKLGPLEFRPTEHSPNGNFVIFDQSNNNSYWSTCINNLCDINLDYNRTIGSTPLGVIRDTQNTDIMYAIEFELITDSTTVGPNDYKIELKGFWLSSLPVLGESCSNRVPSFITPTERTFISENTNNLFITNQSASATVITLEFV
jgi:hypothetical protein